MRRLGKMTGATTRSQRMGIHNACLKKYGLEEIKPCPLCRYEFIYAGHSHALGMGLECLNCGLTLSRDYDEIAKTKKDGKFLSLDQYDIWLLNKIAVIWNTGK